MKIMKTLIGSIVGAALATGVFFLLRNYVLDSEQLGILIWFPIVTGLLTGLLARVFAGPMLPNSSRLMTGATAALISAVAMFGHEIGPPLMDAMNIDASPIRPDEIVAQAKAVNEANDTPDADEPSENDTDQPANGTGEVSDPDRSTEDEAADSQTDRDGLNEGELREMMAMRSRESGDPTGGGGTNIAPLPIEKEEPTLLQKISPYLAFGIGVLLAFQIAVSGRASNKE